MAGAKRLAALVASLALLTLGAGTSSAALTHSDVVSQFSIGNECSEVLDVQVVESEGLIYALCARNFGQEWVKRFHLNGSPANFSAVRPYLSINAITTDLSGFGAYVQRHVDYSQQQGVFVLRRREQSFEQSTDDLTNYLFDFARLTRRQRIELRNRVERLSELFDWSALVRHYHEAHDLALERTLGVRPGKLEIKMV